MRVQAEQQIVKLIEDQVLLACINERQIIKTYFFRGRDFRQACNELKDIRALFMPGVPVVALTAIASCKPRNYIISKWDMENCIVIKSPSNRANIFYEAFLPNWQWQLQWRP